MNNNTTMDDGNALWLMDQQPPAVDNAQSNSGIVKRPLFSLQQGDVSAAAADDVPSTAELSTMPAVGLLILRVRQAHPRIALAAEDILGGALPETLTHVNYADISVSWMSPDEWLISLPLAKIHAMELAWSQLLEGQFAIVNVSAGNVRFELSGEGALSILAKSTAYDVHPDNFPVGKVVGTTLAKTTATIIHATPMRYVIVVRRSFADYVWRWLTDAGKEVGLKTAI